MARYFQSHRGEDTTSGESLVYNPLYTNSSQRMQRTSLSLPNPPPSHVFRHVRVEPKTPARLSPYVIVKEDIAATIQTPRLHIITHSFHWQTPRVHYRRVPFPERSGQAVLPWYVSQLTYDRPSPVDKGLHAWTWIVETSEKLPRYTPSIPLLFSSQSIQRQGIKLSKPIQFNSGKSNSTPSCILDNAVDRDDRRQKKNFSAKGKLRLQAIPFYWELPVK
ncbi:hypothetical protein ONS95_014561 [Cadophora gregata]|uniref:uncharacterized protein n=1 Tax=Cadophora gregata TaxID=51156 RepID=UPI0026DB0C1F|nr:uncharacterized protein ONS95_014561 [Cadophora gregata]KAK0112834.1 hypothetical protein ONS95_014561 [Cadophora gregata]